MAETKTAMGPGLSRHTRSDAGDQGRHLAAQSSSVRPLIGPAPRTTSFFPLVVLTAILPGLIALNSWDLTPPGPLWGLRAMAVLDGQMFDQVPAAEGLKPGPESTALRAISLQPPLYAWLAAVGMKLSTDFDPLASVLPSYVAGVLVVILVSLHGRLWRSGGMGLAAAFLLGFSPNLLLRMQEAVPVTLTLAGAVGALLCYGWYERVSAGAVPPVRWALPAFWALAGGVCLGLSLLALTGFGLIVIPIVLLHHIHLRSASKPALIMSPWARTRRPDRSWKDSALHGLLAILVAMVIALPWHVSMIRIHGWEAIQGLGSSSWGLYGLEGSLLARLSELAPVSLPLGIYGFVRTIRLSMNEENQSPVVVGASLWVIWLGVAALAPAFWPNGPRAVMDLFLLVPLNLLAALTVADLVSRAIPVRALVGLAPATAFFVAWWYSEDLQGAVDDLMSGRAAAATGFGLHLVIDLVLISIWLTRRLERWARHRDDRQRQILAMFLLSVLAITFVSGVREVVFRHSETHDLLSLRTMILRRNRERAFDILAVVGPKSRTTADRMAGHGLSPAPFSGGWLRFILRSTLPRLPQVDLDSIDDLLALPPGHRLIILEGNGQGLTSAVKSKLGLESIHPGRLGILDAYATASLRPSRR